MTLKSANSRPSCIVRKLSVVLLRLRKIFFRFLAAKKGQSMAKTHYEAFVPLLDLFFSEVGVLLEELQVLLGEFRFGAL